MGDREIYPSTPLALVVVEVRHPTAPALSDADKASLKGLLAGSFPLTKPVRRVDINVSSPAEPSAKVVTDTRFMSRDRTASVTFRDNVITVETTRYTRRSALRGLLHQAVLARQKVAPVDGVERLGIRFVNEIRVPELDSPAGWARWVAPALAGPADLHTGDGLEARGWQGVTELGTQSAGIVVRHGVFEGYAVNPAGDLQRSTPPPGPFFLVDMDCFWVPEGETPRLEWETVEDHYDESSLAAYQLFEQLITDDLRQEVLRRDQ
jgi:uncharacterized protein (TIGR04255 family)